MCATLLIRADALPGGGAGHVMRMIALGQSWQDCGGKVVFFGVFSDELGQLLRQENFIVHRAQHVHPHADDIRNSLALGQAVGANWIAADGYHFDPKFQSAVMGAGFRLLLIEDIPNHERYQADILVVQGADPQENTFCLVPGTRGCFGARYALIRKEFFPLRPHSDTLNIPPQRILLSCGGEDARNCTELFLLALEHAGWSDQLTVLMGSASRRAKETTAIIQRNEAWNALPYGQMAPLLDRTDILLGAGGGTCWEACYMGVPSFCVSVAANQTPVLKRLSQGGVLRYAGTLDTLSAYTLSASLRSFLDDSCALKKMQKACLDMVDGQGGLRIVRSMLECSQG